MNEHPHLVGGVTQELEHGHSERRLVEGGHRAGSVCAP